MAITFFWRCEGTTLDGTHDFSAGDTTATAANSVSITSGAARVGTNGVHVSGLADRYEFDCASIGTPSVGSFACSLKVTTWGDGSMIIGMEGSNNKDHVQLFMSGTDELRLNIRRNGGTSADLTTTAADIATGTWYGIVCRWDQAANDRRIEVYNASNSLIHSVEDLSTSYDQPTDFTNTAGFKVGDIGGGNGVFDIDNVFWSQVYSETLENNLTISSYTEYGGAALDPIRLVWRQ